MGQIQVLESHVVNQIAAGEVIERPASAVKELVENALDAGARRIEVRVEEGGRALIEVTDDGHGMDGEDIARAFLPHATSKIRSAEDLRHVGSLGFRGEALASLGSVAAVSIVSRAEGAETGWRVENRDGVVAAPSPVAAAPGTVVRVSGLFQHVPARRKFLRSPATELGHVSTLMGRFAVAYPDVAFRLRRGSRTLVDVVPTESRLMRIAAVHGPDNAEGLLSVEAHHGGMHLEAWVGSPSKFRSDGRLEQCFLNGRFLQDRTVAHAIRRAYEGLLPPGGKRPIAFLFLTCDPEGVDVNVHPAKAEVRWHDGQAVHRLVRSALRDVLEGAAPGLAVPLEGRGVPDSTREAVELAFTEGPRSQSGSLAAPWVVRERPASAPEPVGAPGEQPARTPRGLRPVGQVLGTYLVLEGEGELVLVDQHALHERVLYERISTRLREAGALEVQRLLVPTVVEVDPAEAAVLTEQSDLLRSLGWHVDAFGDGTVAIQGIPAVLRRPDPEATLREILDALSRGGREGLDRAALLGDAVDRMACRAAVMAGDVLHTDEVLALLEEAERLNHAHSCPHGRPTRLTMTRAQLERWFHRTV